MPGLHLTPNIDENGAEKRANLSRALLILAAMLLIVPNLPAAARWTGFGVLLAGGVFARFRAKKRWCVLRACGIKTSV